MKIQIDDHVYHEQVKSILAEKNSLKIVTDERTILVVSIAGFYMDKTAKGVVVKTKLL